MAKKDMQQSNPDSFDGYDFRKNEFKPSDAYMQSVMPQHLRDPLAAKTARKPKNAE